MCFPWEVHDHISAQFLVPVTWRASSCKVPQKSRSCNKKKLLLNGRSRLLMLLQYYYLYSQTDSAHADYVQPKASIQCVEKRHMLKTK
jgi:hypothetical protein